ncbi:MAG: NADH-quinone oxidoreductase subunit J [Bacteroidales bacterium]|jgi:NADH-quinone oxidoreductase subunit J
MDATQIMFILFAVAIIVFSVLTVTSRKILRASVYLLFVLVSTSGLYFMLNYQFLAAVQLTLYAGGIVVLIIFSILLTSHIDHKFEPVGWKKSLLAALASVAGTIVAILTILDFKFRASGQQALNTDMHTIGRSLLSLNYDGYILPFEVISVLLIAAMVAAIVIAKKGSPAKEESKNLNK